MSLHVSARIVFPLSQYYYNKLIKVNDLKVMHVNETKHSHLTSSHNRGRALCWQVHGKNAYSVVLFGYNDKITKEYSTLWMSVV
jgi:hypothetical protein